MDQPIGATDHHLIIILEISVAYTAGVLKSFPGGPSAAEFSSNPDQTHLPVIL